ncbi:MAG: DinB family protein [Phycisphaerae bacterium]|jgi:uncharacterized damage-inducible protein DinB
MIDPSTLRELFEHNDWARDKLMTLAADLTDAQLDRPFEMGEGSLRATLRHYYGAERIWAQHVRMPGCEAFPHSRTLEAVSDLRHTADILAEVRRRWLDTLPPEAMGQTATYTTSKGETYTTPLGDILLHVCNHGFHHRAQALNMLRHLGVETPMLDFLLMKLERPTIPITPTFSDGLRALGLTVPEQTVAARPLDPETMRAGHAYGDMANERLCRLAVELSDEQLDRPFEIGLGTLRKTLLHIRDAEQWWYENWINPAPVEFAKLPPETSIGDLQRLFAETTERRDAFVEQVRGPDLERVVTAEVRPGACLSFRLGETMLQLFGHGTHHRAQALNMLRHLGAEVPALDYIAWLWGRQPGVAGNERR